MTAAMQPPDPTVVEQVSEVDRAWFEAHPGRRTYVRRLVSAEGPGPLPWSGNGVAAVVVNQVRPGVRVRLPAYLPKLPPDTEQDARTVLRRVMKAAGGAR